MALNPELIQGNDYLFPVSQGNEFTFLRRGDVMLKLFLPNRTIKEEGMVFLTSTRLVFVKNPKSKTNSEFKGIEMPLNLIESPRFEQPIFGMNYLCGFVNPLTNSPNSLRNKCKWHLCFSKGGSSTSFLTCFGKVYDESKRGISMQPMGQTNDSFFSSTNAYMDPNDPTYLYISETPSQPLYQPTINTHQHYSPMPEYQVNQPNPYQPVPSTSYQPTTPTSYQPNQINQNSHYQVNPVNPPMQYQQPNQPGQANLPNQYQSVYYQPNQYQMNHYVPNNMNTPNNNVPYFETIRTDLSPQLNAYLTNQTRGNEPSNDMNNPRPNNTS